MNFKDERTITVLFIFFHLENIITKISLVNERPYKMAKPASLYPGYQRFFFSWRMVGCFGVGHRPTDLRSKAGRSCGSQFKDLSDTGNRAWKVSGTHGRKRYKDVKNNCLNTRIQSCVWFTVLQTIAWETQFPEYVRFLQQKILQRLIYPIQGRYSRFVFQVIYNSDRARKIK